MKKILIVLITAVCLAPQASAQDRPLLDNKIPALFHEALSGETAKEHVIAISRYHRIQGSRQYRDAANYVLDQLYANGFTEDTAYIESYESDGRKVYETWQSPSGWDVEEAELRIVSPVDERICGYPEIAMSLITYSNPGDVTADLVWVGAGTSDADYAGKDVRGKFVLATGYGGNVHRLAVLKYGAAAVVCYLDDERAMEYPDMLAYTGMWPKTDELGRVTFGFNLTKRQGERLRGMLERGQRVTLRGWVKGTGLEPFYMDVPWATIPGSEFPDEQLVFAGHLDHPKESANDNASGSAAMLDIAITLLKLIDSGKIDPPKRSISFMWVPEFYGTMAFLDGHPEMKGPAYGGTWLGAINMDMVGEHLELIHTNMNFTQTPKSINSVLNDVVENMAQMVDGMDIRTPRGSLSRFNYRMTPYSGGSDHNIFIDRRIPALMFGHGDYTHHTSEDTPDKVDPVELERTEVIGAGTMWYLANLDERQAFDLSALASANAARELGLAGRRALTYMSRVIAGNYRPAWAQAQNILDMELQWQTETLESVYHFIRTRELADYVDIHIGTLNAQHEALSNGLKETFAVRGYDVSETPRLEPVSDEDTLIPVRLTRGPLSSDATAGFPGPQERRMPPLSGNALFEIANFMDGETTMFDVYRAVDAEYGPVPKQGVYAFIRFLVDSGLAEWK